jgi:catalase
VTRHDIVQRQLAHFARVDARLAAGIARSLELEVAQPAVTF